MHTQRWSQLLLFIGLFALAAACGNAPSQEKEQESDDMAQFADDPEFQGEHPGPTEVNLAGDGEMIRFATPDGEDAGAYALMVENSNKYLIVIHEWWGLNDNIKSEAERYYKELGDVNVLAIDIYDGKVATDPETAGKYMQSVEQDRAEAIVQGALNKAGEEAEIATIGWCFGGGWSLKTSIMAGDRGTGCVMFYGMPVQSKEALQPLEADILGIFAKQDGWITPEVASNFEKLAKSAGKDIEIHQFDADHAFANPSNPNYVESAAQEANKLAVNFLKSHL